MTEPAPRRDLALAVTMVPMGKSHEEWLRQADYDMDTAEFMLKGGRSFYAAFMCHLAIEKAVKGLYQWRLRKVPPKVHNLVFLIRRVGIRPPEGVDMLMARLSEAQIATRYPEDLASVQADYGEDAVREVIAQSKEVLKWIKQQF